MLSFSLRLAETVCGRFSGDSLSLFVLAAGQPTNLVLLSGKLTKIAKRFYYCFNLGL